MVWCCLGATWSAVAAVARGSGQVLGTSMSREASNGLDLGLEVSICLPSIVHLTRAYAQVRRQKLRESSRFLEGWRSFPLIQGVRGSSPLSST